MSVIPITAGPFSAIYVGTGTGNEVLKLLVNTRTGGSRMRYETQTDYFHVLNNQEQIGEAKLTLPLTFYAGDPNVLKLAMNNPLSQANQDDPSHLATYTALFIHPSGGPYSLLLPFCWTDITVDEPQSKTAAYTCPVLFRAQNPNRFVNLYYQRTPAALKAILGSRSPF